MRKNPRPVSFICSEIAVGAVALCAASADASTFAATAAPAVPGAVTSRQTPPCEGETGATTRPARVSMVSQRGVKVTLWDENTPAAIPLPAANTHAAAAGTMALVQPCAPVSLKHD